MKFPALPSHPLFPALVTLVALTAIPARADVARYRAVVQAEPSLLSFYPFDGDAATTVTDRKAPLQNGTLSGATFSSAAGTVGGQSVQGARVALGPVPENEFPDGSGTVEMFLYQTATAAYNPCFFAGRDDAASPTVRYSMHAGANGAQLWIWNGATALSVATPVSMLNNLVHVAYVYNAGTLTVYFNGALLTTWSIPLGAGTGRPFQIGASGPANQEAWPGRIDEVAIYADALSAAAVAAHYNAFLFQSNALLLETFTGLGGTAVTDLTGAAAFPDNPTSSSLWTDGFVLGTNVADNFGRRVSGFVVPPVSGSYTFWISSADASELWLGSSADPTTRARIASVAGATAPFQWTAEPGQQSAPVPLTAGQRYYVEALHQAGVGPDHLAVRWRLPNAVIEEPIPVSRLQPFGFEPPALTLSPTNLTVIEPNPASFNVAVFRRAGVSYQWQRNGSDIPGATTPQYTIPTTSPADHQAVFRCVVANAFGTNVSAEATLTVQPDTFAPVVQSIATLGGNVISLTFDEPLALSATNLLNFSLDHAASVQTATFGLSPNVLILTTTELAPGTSYLLTLREIADRFGNSMAAATTVSVTATGYEPLPVRFLKPPPEPIGPATRRGPLVISEIHYHPTNRTDLRQLEFVEIHNTEVWPEDLGGYRLSGEIDYTIPAGTTVAAGGYLVIAPAPGDLTAVHGVAKVLGGFTNRLNNAGGTLRLRNPAGAVVFEVDYDSQPPWPAAADGAGHSLVLARPSLGMNVPDAWEASRLPGGSPGTAEPSGPETATLPVVINEFLANGDDTPDFVELFNYSAQDVSLAGWSLSDDAGTNKLVFGPTATIGPRGYVVLDEGQLGFSLSANGETIWLRDAGGRVIDAARYGGQQRGVSTGRTPDGAAEFNRLRGRTPGAANAARLAGDVVLNEILYHPISGVNADEFIELHNRTADPVNVGGWRLRGGVNYTLPAGRVIPPRGYLVIAADATSLIARYPNLSAANTVGNFNGQLANSGELVRLEAAEVTASTNGALVTTNTVYYTVSEVTYGTGGRWGRWSDGGGSSLILTDPAADPRRAANWSDSDESSASGWTTIEFTGVLDNGQGTPDRLQILAQGEGEFLVDEVEVLQVGNPANRLSNPGFENGAAGWLLQGSHSTSTVDDSGGVGGSKCLHVRATSRGDTSANRIQATLTSAFAANQFATIRARVRWLKGHPEVLLRLRGSWLEAAGQMLTTTALGSPGRANPLSAAPAGGPAIHDVIHEPVLPAAGQAVTVLARVDDPQGVGSVAVQYRIDPSPETLTVNMIYRGAGWFSAELPAQAGGALAAFQVLALDGGGALARFPQDAPAREALIRWGEPIPGGALGTYRFWMTQATRSRWESRERNSNEPLDVTFVYGDRRVIYNADAQYSGSPFHTGGFNSPLGNACDYTLGFPDDDRMLGETGMILAGPGTFGDDLTFQRENMLWWMARQMGGPALHRRFIRLYVDGQKRQSIFEDTQQPNAEFIREWFPGDDQGDLFKAQDWIEFADDGATFLGGLQRAVLGRFTTTNNLLPAKRYRWMWAPRAVSGPVHDFTNFFTLVETLNLPDPNLYTAQVEALLDVESWSRALAVQRIVGNWDSWGWSYGKNMYAYKPRSGRWAMVPWDLDFSYGTVGLSGGNPAGDSPTSDLFSNTSGYDGGSPGDPVASTFRNNPRFRRAYARALLDAANGPMADGVVQARLARIQSALQAEGLTPAPTDGIRTFISARRAYILSQLASLLNAPLAITSNGGADFTTDSSVLRLTGTAPAALQTLLVNGAAYPVTWTTPTNWSLLLPLAPGLNSLTLTGSDQRGQLLPNLTDTIAITSTATPVAPEGQVVINEIQYNPLTPDTAFVELLNAGTNTFDLSGWRLDGIDFNFPPGSVITNRQLLVIAADRYAFGHLYGAAAVVAGDFDARLDNDGEVLSLLQPTGTNSPPAVIDRVRYEAIAPWPDAANGFGPSLQLIDPTADNARVSNWSDGSGWRFFSFTGTINSSRLSFLFDVAGGDLYLDDLSLVPGTVPGAGVNSIVNGNFETALGAPWIATGVATNTELVKDLRHAGQASLHYVQLPGSVGLTTFYQDVNPAVATNTTYTLSGWYLPGASSNTNFTLRTGSAFQTRPNLRPIGPTPGLPNLTAGSLTPFPTLWLNEALVLNMTGATDNAGEREPWIELHNAGPEAVSLDGLSLSDTYANLTRWTFPPGRTIPGGGFLVVWMDGQPQQTTPSALHASFRLAAADSGSVVLSRTGSGAPQILDYFNYAGLPANQSFGSVPDGQPFYRGVRYYPTPGAANDRRSAPLAVRINEWMAANTRASGIADPADGDYDDWFEVYNPGATAVDLGGYYLTDNLENPFQFGIPDNGHYRIPAGGYLLVWADGEPGQNSTNRVDLHVNFSLRAAGEAIGLFAADGTRIDAVTFTNQLDNVSVGRSPDGSGNIATLAAPSPRAGNGGQTPPTAPVLGAVTLTTAGVVRFTVSAEAGRSYQVEYQEVLGGTEWTALGGPRVATGASLLVEDSAGGGPQRFYRVTAIP